MAAWEQVVGVDPGLVGVVGVAGEEAHEAAQVWARSRNWPEQGKLPAKGKEYPELGYKRVRDKPPKAQQQQQQQQPAAAQ
ncbi:hypothetical protein QJQ45_011240 [Haematococcus lacustris]|nr:hypothetical protein QJQ45_011240 [Haematococcus lacustris]